MVSNKVYRHWVNMVCTLDPESITPQHGAPLIGKKAVGKKAVGKLLDWIESLECGVDLMT